MDSKSESWWMVGLSVVASRPCTEVRNSDWRGSASVAFMFLMPAACMLIAVLITWLSPGGPAWGCLRRRSSWRLLPGPRGWPVVGSLAMMGGRRVHISLAKLANSLGARRLMALSVGGTRVVISSHPDVAREILNSSSFADRPVKESAYRLMFHRAIGFAPYGEYWRHLRRIAAMHLFAPKRITAFERQRQVIADSIVNDISGSMSAVGSVRVREIFQRGSLNNVMGSVFGRNYDLLMDDDSEARELSSMVKEGYELLGTFNWADHIPLLRFLDIQGIRKRCSNLVPKVYAFVNKIINEHRAAQSDNNNHHDSDFVDVLLALEGENKLNDEDMVAVLWEMIFRGTDTVAIVMEWTLARLVLHRDIQFKVHEELERVVGNSRRVSESDIPKLEYLQAVVKEVLRMHPPGPLLSWARLATDDVVVGGHLIPAGTTAMVNMWAITHDQENWKEPHTFCPNRFLPAAGGEEVNIMGVDLKLAPFGSGRRVCPGKTLGLATIHLWLARLLHHFEWIPELSDQPVDLSEVLRLSCELRVALSAKVIPRSLNFQLPMPNMGSGASATPLC